MAAVCLAAWTTPSQASAAGRIAYLAHTDNFWQVWVMDADGGSQHQVTSSPFEKARVSWHPDGRRVLVSRLDASPVWVDVETGDELVVETPLSGIVDAVVSPDGTRIAFSAYTAEGRDHNQIWVANADGRELRRMTSMGHLQHEPQWSRDGKWIYFLSGDGGQAHDIWRISTDGTTREQLTAGSRYHFELAPGVGGRLAFSSNRSDNYEIWSWLPGNGEDPRQLTRHKDLDGGPSWSPDGSALVFHSARSGGLEIWRVSAEGGEPTRLTHTAGARSPAWWNPGAPAR